MAEPLDLTDVDEADRDLLRRIDRAFCTLHDPMPAVHKEPVNTDARSHYYLQYDWTNTAPRFSWDLNLMIDTLYEVGDAAIPQRQGVLHQHGGIIIKVWRASELSRRRKRTRESRDRQSFSNAPAPPAPVGEDEALRAAKRARTEPPAPETTPGSYPPFQTPAPSPRFSSPVNPSTNSLPLYPGLSPTAHASSTHHYY